MIPIIKLQINMLFNLGTVQHKHNKTRLYQGITEKPLQRNVSANQFFTPVQAPLYLRLSAWTYSFFCEKKVFK